MRLVPSGSERLMIAQTMNPNKFGLDFGNETEELVPGAEELAPNTVPEVPEVPNPTVESAPKEDSEDLTQYIFNRLTQLGYPPRRLESYEDKFVHERITRDGGREVTIVIPDRYYGSKKSLSKEDFSGIVNDIQNKFGLNFTDADRSDLKLTINFTSANPDADENESALQVEDELTQVYGPGKENSGEKTKRKKKVAYTIQELMSQSKKNLWHKLYGDDDGFTKT